MFYVYVFYCSSYVCFLVLYVWLSILYALCFCVVLCICLLMYTFVSLFFICVHVYGPLPPGDNPTAVNKYHIINSRTRLKTLYPDVVSRRQWNLCQCFKQNYFEFYGTVSVKHNALSLLRTRWRWVRISCSYWICYIPGIFRRKSVSIWW
jgi:hypothetical protein